MEKDEMEKMLIEYMDKGFLENIISLIKTDQTLFDHIPALLQDENMRVRLGAVALIEEFLPRNPEDLGALVPSIAALLQHESPNVRGDAAYALGIIGDPAAAPALRSCLDDESRAVAESCRDSLDDIRKSAGTS